MSLDLILLKLNIPVKIASVRFGHLNIVISSDLYQQVDVSMQRNSVDKLNELFKSKIRMIKVTKIKNRLISKCVSKGAISPVEGSGQGNPHGILLSR